MKEEQLKRKIIKLEEQLKNIQEYKEFKNQSLDCARKIKILFDTFEENGFDKEFVKEIILKSVN